MKAPAPLERTSEGLIRGKASPLGDNGRSIFSYPCVSMGIDAADKGDQVTQRSPVPLKYLRKNSQ